MSFNPPLHREYCLIFSRFLLCCFYFFKPHCAPCQTIVKLLNDSRGRIDWHKAASHLITTLNDFETSVKCTMNYLERKPNNSELSIHFHNHIQQQFQQWGKGAVKHVKRQRCTSHFTAYFVFGGLHVCFESQSKVVRGLHQVLRGTDQNLVNWTRHGPWRLHQRTSLSGRERKDWRHEWWRKTVVTAFWSNRGVAS